MHNSLLPQILKWNLAWSQKVILTVTAWVVDPRYLKNQVTDVAGLIASDDTNVQESVRSVPFCTMYSVTMFTSTAETWTVREQINQKMSLKPLCNKITELKNKQRAMVIKSGHKAVWLGEYKIHCIFTTRLKRSHLVQSWVPSLSVHAPEHLVSRN